MKAQQVKNALIVPAGAKGGFITKNLSADSPREQVIEEGISCYQGFINGLLDLTDNLVGDKVQSPPNTICYDDADTYLVVAADKGTATFSDIANKISLEKGFWLGDAFASGGSSGYDHKKMGITARGAWVSAERHFQELGVNVDEAEITVVGIGDMSGDVFGNGMLLSPHLKLVCAYNHLHIFVDPSPDPALSFAERKRLFNLPRSSWNDYEAQLISKGGGVFLRTAKAIVVTPEMKALFDIDKDVLTPNDLIKAALKSPVDLIWNGGIGTFVKASTETNNDVGDRGNDAIRINGNELRARVVCEGGNLGLTQLGRVEYALMGGKINTDFIDNSGGVDCSDHEVNIKILLNAVMNNGDMTLKQRNQLLIKMTDEVADLVLQNNYHQNLAISLASYQAPAYLSLYMRYIDALEEKKRINRTLEFLPDNKTLLERKAAGLGLTRPELAILLSYSKIILDTKIRKSGLTKDPYLSQYVQHAFPTPLRKRYGDLLLKHKLYNEIVSTQISNQLVAEMGITFVYQMQDETGSSTASIVKAYVSAREIFHTAELFAEIESLDYKVDIAVQYRMFQTITGLIRRSTRWILRSRRGRVNVVDTIDHFASSVEILFKQLPKLLIGIELANFEERRDALIAANVPKDIAIKVASAGPIYHALNIVDAVTSEKANIYDVTKIYFTLVDRLSLAWFKEQIDEYPADSRWLVLARSAYKADLDLILRELTIGLLNFDTKKKNLTERIDEWFDKHHTSIERWNRLLSDLRSTERKEFTVFAVAVRELADLAAMNS